MLKQPAGTPRYMVPEQKRKAEADIRNDIYSLGIILEQMQLGNTYRLVAAKCLRPADERYQNVAELKQDLRRRIKAKKNLFWRALVIVLLAMVGAMVFTIHLIYGQRQTINFQQQQLAIQRNKMAQQQQLMTLLKQDVSDGKVQQNAQHLVINSLTDSITTLFENNLVLIQKQKMEQMKKEKVEEAKKIGKKAIDEAYRQARFEQIMNERMDWEQTLKAMNQCISSATTVRNQYLLSIRSQFSDNEFITIERSLSAYDDEHYMSKWKVKIERATSIGSD